MIERIRRHLAARRLARMVEQRRKSFEVEQYRRRRAAALKHTRNHPSRDCRCPDCRRATWIQCGGIA